LLSGLTNLGSKLISSIGSGLKTLGSKFINSNVGKTVVNALETAKDKKVNVGKAGIDFVKDKASSLVNGVKSFFSGTKAGETASKVTSVVEKAASKVNTKSLIPKIKSVLSKMKSLVIKKIGPKGGAKLLGKIASRFIPFAGWALLAYDAVKIAWYMLHEHMSLPSAVSKQILGFDIFDNDEVPKDPDTGELIKPDEDKFKTAEQKVKEKVKAVKETSKKEIEDSNHNQHYTIKYKVDGREVKPGVKIKLLPDGRIVTVHTAPKVNVDDINAKLEEANLPYKSINGQIVLDKDKLPEKFQKPISQMTPEERKEFKEYLDQAEDKLVGLKLGISPTKIDKNLDFYHRTKEIAKPIVENDNVDNRTINNTPADVHLDKVANISNKHLHVNKEQLKVVKEQHKDLKKSVNIQEKMLIVLTEMYKTNLRIADGLGIETDDKNNHNTSKSYALADMDYTHVIKTSVEDF
jgi:hypothetical protein